MLHSHVLRNVTEDKQHVHSVSAHAVYLLSASGMLPTLAENFNLR